MDKHKDIRGSGGGTPDYDPPRVPVEDPNNLNSKNTLRFIDMLGEGEIFGLYDGAKSIYLNEVPLENAVAERNFGGVTYYEKKGTVDQSVINGFSTVESEVGVNVQVTYPTPIVRAISSTDVDDVRFTFTIPQLTSTDVVTGDMTGTTIQFFIEASINGGAYAGIHGVVTKTGKCTAPYQFSVRVTIPWSGSRVSCNIRVSRLTADSTSAYLVNATWWSSYTEIINEKLIYPDTAYIAYFVDAEYFGRNAPTRIYDLKGMLIQVPNNYNPATVDTNYTGSYTGAWNGTFQTAYSNNPAWVYYDLLTNTRYGMGIDPQYIDKWALYTAGYYCDGEVDTGFGGSERRFTFNGVIENRAEAYHVLGMVSSVFRSMPFWGTGLATVAPDMPTDPTRLVTGANVIGGEFEYQGTGIRARHTVAYVTWNDPDDFCRPRIEAVQDAAGIARYGYNEIEVVAYGCTSRGQAHRFGKWILYSDINQTEMLTYRAGFDHVDCVPGEIIKVQDADYAGNIRFGGRVVSSTNTTITIDHEVEIEAGESYILHTLTSSGTLQENPVDEGTPSIRTVIEITDSFDENPLTESVWMLTATNLEPRHFRVLSVIEKEPNTFEINAVVHDPNKFAIVEDGVIFDDPPFVRVPTGKLDPPTAIAAEEYTYADGASNQQFGILLSWTHSPDPRTYFYETQLRNNTYAEVWHSTGGTRGTGETGDNSIALTPVVSGTYDFRVRAKGTIDSSEWLTLSDHHVYGDPDPLPDISGLQVVGGGTTFNGKDCEIEWDTVSGTVYRWKDYVVEVYTTADALLRTDQIKRENYTYWYDWNQIDNGTPIRSIKFKIYARDTYDKLSQTAATAIMSNPAPSMAGNTPDVTEAYKALNIEIDNIVPADNDYDLTKIYCDTSTPPTTLVGDLSKGSTILFVPELNPELTYYVQCVPYDLFGIGTASDILGGNDPKSLEATDIDIELSTSIIMSTSVAGWSNAELQVLYDRDTTTSGFTFTTVAADTWIQYSYALQDFQDRVVVWTHENSPGPKLYFALTTNSGVSWTYYAAGDDEDPGLENYSYMTAHATQSGGAANAISAPPGQGIWKFPERTTATDFRMYIANTAGTEMTFNELIPFRELIAEMVVTDELSAITANLGIVTAGIIQSNDVEADAGVVIDLDNEIFRVGGATDPFLYIDGVQNRMEMSGDSSLNIKEGGKITAGDGNFALTTENVDSHAVLTMAEDGGIQADGSIADGKDYLTIDEQHINTYLWHAGSGEHKHFRTLRKVVAGVADNNTWANVGFFPAQPVIMLSPANLQCYNTTYKLQSQSFRMEVRDFTQAANGDWSFRPYAQLVLTDGSGNTNVAQTRTSTTNSTWIQSSGYSTPANTNRIIFNITLQSQHGTGTANEYYYRTTEYQVYANGQWYGSYFHYHGATIGPITLTVDLTVPAAAHTVYIRSRASDTGGTFYVGAQVWEYQWVYAYGSTGSNSVSSTGPSPEAQGYVGPFTLPALPSVPGGWTDTGSYNANVNMRTRITVNGGASYLRSEGEVYVLNDFVGDYTSPLHRVYTSSTSYDSGLVGINKQWNYNRAGDDMRLWLQANPLGDTGNTVTTYGYIDLMRTGRYVKREAAGSTAISNSMTFNNFTYYLGTYQVLADGTINYWAIDTGAI